MTVTTNAENSLPKSHSWVVFGPDWGRHSSTTQHLFSELLVGGRMIWVETVGLRSPSWSLRDVRRGIQKIADFVTGRRHRISTKQSGLVVVSPITLPFTRLKVVRKINRWLVRRSVSAAIRRLGFQKHVLVVTAPHHCDFVGAFDEVCSVYYCQDRHELWPGMNSSHVTNLERQLVERVDMIVAVSTQLVESKSVCGKTVHVLAQGVDVEHFARSLPHCPTGKFEIVYFGMIDERMDTELVLEVARSLPEATVRLIGPRVIADACFTQQANIRLEPPVGYDVLPEQLRSADLFILPFLQNDLAKSCNPLKLKEYLACGRPVVSTTIPYAESLVPHVCVAEDHASFVDAVRRAKQRDLEHDSAEVVKLLAQETWGLKAKQFEEWVLAECSRLGR